MQAVAGLLEDRGARIERGFASVLATDGDGPLDGFVERSEELAWLLDDPSGCRPVADLGEVALSAHRWRLHLPEPLAETEDGAQLASPSVGEATLVLAVSADEESVHATLRLPSGAIDLEERIHHTLLLCLARARREDQALPEPERGWLYRDAVAKQLGTDVAHVAQLIFRARRQAAAAGVQDAAVLVQARRLTQQIRLGLGRFELLEARPLT